MLGWLQGPDFLRWQLCGDYLLFFLKEEPRSLAGAQGCRWLFSTLTLRLPLSPSWDESEAELVLL